MQDKRQEEGTPGTYVLNAIYILLSIVTYLFVFWQLSQRWPVG